MAVVCGVAASAMLAACGGNSTGNATISGTVTGLQAGTSVSISNNGGTPLVISSTGRSTPIGFSFSNTVPSNSGYSVIVTTQPTNQTCVVNYGSGVTDFSGNNISTVAVACSPNIAIGVSTTGLNSGNSATFTLTLQNDALNYYTTTVSSSAPAATFPVLLPLGTIYNITVSAQPGQTSKPGTTTPPAPPSATGIATQTCTTASASSGGVVNSSAINVAFSCH